jgi:hypothetical protein
MVKRVTFKLDKAKSPIRHSPRKVSATTNTRRPPPRRKAPSQEKRPINDPNTSFISNFIDDFYRQDTPPPPLAMVEKALPSTPLPNRYSDICSAISATISPRSLTNMDRAGRTARASRTRSAAISQTEMRLLANERTSTDAGVPTYLRELLIRAKERRPFTHYTSLAHAIPISPDNRPQAAVDATVFFLATLPGKKADLFAVEDFIRIKCPNLKFDELHNTLQDAKCIKLSQYCLSDSGHNLVYSSVSFNFRV